jgi:hypothetical protein
MLMPFGIIGAGLGVVVVLLVASTLFRAAVALANSTIGPVKPNPSLAWDWEAAEDDEEYKELGRKLKAIPEPGLGQGMLIMLVVGAVQLVVSFVLTALFELDRRGRRDELEEVLPPILLDVAVGFVVLTGLAASMMPTTARRAALAAFYFYVIAVALVALIFGLLYFALALR